MSIPRDRWPTIVGILGAVALLIGLGIGRPLDEVDWSADSFMGLGLSAWAVAASFLVVFLTVQIVLNARATLKRERRLVETAAELRETGAELERLAKIDPLTGVLNRRALFEQLGAELRRSQRYGRVLTAMMIDLDDFKSLNDRYGHWIGDEVLAACARAISSNLRESDVVGRYGGEEFAVVLPETSLADGAFVAEKLRLAIEALSIESPDGGAAGVAVTISVGVAAIASTGTPDGQSLLNRADQALYEAKRGGRNQIAVAGSPAAPEIPSAAG